MEMEFTGFRFKCASALLRADCFSIECGFQPSQASGKLVLLLSFQMRSQVVSGRPGIGKPVFGISGAKFSEGKSWTAEGKLLEELTRKQKT